MGQLGCCVMLFVCSSLLQSLLTFLKDKVVFDGLIDPAFSSTSSKSSSISYTSILEWTGLILDTHFTSLSLIPEAKSILLILHKNVSKQVCWLSLLFVTLISFLSSVWCSFLRCLFRSCFSLASLCLRVSGTQNNSHWEMTRTGCTK